MTAKLHIVATVTDAEGGAHTITTTGQVARTLRALTKAGSQGITALDVAGTWALRLSHYVFVLRRDYQLSIPLTWEAHDGAAGPGRHGRYRLETPVRIVSANDAEAA
jgi:hypothetical protein